MPASCSRITRLTASMRTCILRKYGTARLMMSPTASSSTGTATTRIHDSVGSSLTAKMTPPIARMGVDTRIVQVMSTNICTCCTSFVVRVMSDGAPNLATSRSEKSPTRVKTVARRSRPSDIATRAPK